MEASDANQDTNTASNLDLELHHSIAFAAHNRTLTHMMTALYDLNRSSLFYNREELLNIDKAGEELFEQHRDIVDAICQSKPARAEKAAHKHIEYVSSLVENAFERRSREEMSRKRHTKK